MQFIKVTAEQCNSQGLTAHTGSPTRTSPFHLNTDLIGAFMGNEVILKGGTLLNIGGNFYKNIRLADGVVIP